MLRTFRLFLQYPFSIFRQNILSPILCEYSGPDIDIVCGVPDNWDHNTKWHNVFLDLLTLVCKLKLCNMQYNFSRLFNIRNSLALCLHLLLIQ